ncbi:NAD-dependent epimerase/dehydratase family protein [Micromonospora sp. NPDC048930]|uniref:NAD-dependent epimerase/dehydratase family protein n=1 Tax=Micromonospora sp. NPDC048930 TaxID=3364261 RepID=UPI00371637BA
MIDMILVTGGLGFIGSHTARSLLDLGDDVVLGQRRAAGADTPAAAKIARIDCTDLDSVLAAGRRHHITGIVHLAAAGLGDGSTLDKLWADARSCFTILRAAREWNVDRVVLASTIGVYGGVSPADGVLREDSPLPIASLHAIPAAKKVAEVVADAVAAYDGLGVIVARIGAIWGPLGRPASPFFAAPQLVHAVVRGAPVPGASAPHADDAIDMLYARDCGRALALLATSTALRHRTYNVGSGTLTTNGEIAAAISRIVPDAPVTLAPGRSDHAPVRDVVLDIERLRADTGFAPAYDLDAAVADYAAWLREHDR